MQLLVLSLILAGVEATYGSEAVFVESAHSDSGNSSANPLAGMVQFVNQSAVSVPRRICDARVAKPLVRGRLSNGQVDFDSGCQYKLWERDAAGSCLRNTWIGIVGSSNTVLEFQYLLNLLAPDEWTTDRPGKPMGTSAVADVIIKDGKVIHWATVQNNDRIVPACKQGNKNESAGIEPACVAEITKMLATAPSYDSTATRITMFLALFWQRTNMALDILGADTAWRAAEIALVVQIGAWYNVCAIWNWGGSCPRPEVTHITIDAAVEVFRVEMAESLVKLQKFCSPGGRAAVRGCNIQTISWTGYGPDNDSFKLMNGYLERAMDGLKSQSFRFVDFWALGGSMPSETVAGHGSPMLNLWMWQVMFDAMCPADLASPGTEMTWHGQLCTGTQARWENCPNYFPSCMHGIRCALWECMGSIPCTYTASEPRRLIGIEDAPAETGITPPKLLV